MIRHRVNTTDFSLEALSNVVELEIPEPPTNLQGLPEQQGTALRLSWEAPLTGVRPILYEIFLDGAFLARTTSLHYTLNDIQYGVHYLLKVRSVAVLGGRSVFTPVLDHIGGGRPDMYVRTFPSYLAIRVIWKEVEPNVDYTIEGYNVYRVLGTTYEKANSSTIPLGTNGWDFFNLAAEQQYRFAVTFLYNGGQESPYFEITDVPRATFGNFKVVLTSIHQALVSTPRMGKASGIKLGKGGWVRIMRTDLKIRGTYKWLDGSRTGLGYAISVTGMPPIYYTVFADYSAPCRPPKITAEGETEYYTVFQHEHEQIYAALTGTWRGFAISGCCCPGAPSMSTTIEFLIAVGGSQTLYVEHPSDPGKRFYTLDTVPTVRGVPTGDSVLVTWDKNASDGYNVFIRTSETQFEKLNTEPIYSDSYLITDLAPNTYFVVVGYITGTYETKPIEVENPLTVVIV